MNFDLKQFEGLKTPFYWYDSQLLDQTLQTVKSLADRHGYHVHYAVKANGNLEILRRVNAAGLGTDCVSGNEILQSIAAGIAPEKIAFAGVGKSELVRKYAQEYNPQKFRIPDQMYTLRI